MAIIDYSISSSQQIEADICQQINAIRLSRNMTQKQLASSAGVSLRTIARLVNGEGVSLNTFIRVMMALGIVTHLETLLPNPNIQPIQRLKLSGKERKRATGEANASDSEPWTWGDDSHGQ